MTKGSVINYWGGGPVNLGGGPESSGLPFRVGHIF